MGSEMCIRDRDETTQKDRITGEEIPAGYRVYPMSISKTCHHNSMNLLMYQKHYILITDLDRCINSGDGTPMFHCERCLRGFGTAYTLAQHRPACGEHAPARVCMPGPSNCEIKFNPKKNLRLPIAIYADFEACNVPVGEEISVDKHTAKRTEHRIISGAFYIANRTVTRTTGATPGRTPSSVC